jgi:hypothetical protein
MPSTLSVGDVPSSQPKVQVIAKTWDLKIGPTIIRGEVHEAQWIMPNFIKYFASSLKELGHLRGQEVQIILEDDNPIFKWFDKLSEVKGTLV